MYATGSFGRGEASSFSDLDLFIVGRSIDKRRALGNLDEICIKADLIDVTLELNIPEFSGDGAYLASYEILKLVNELGTPQDDAHNTFTARLLLLLESRALIGEPVYNEGIGECYLRLLLGETSKTTRMNLFLHICRMIFLKVTANFRGQLRSEYRSDPPEKKAEAQT